MVKSEQDSDTGPGSKVQDHTPLLMRLGLIGASSFALFYSLGDRLLKTWDESIYAEVAKEMLKQHSWLTPHWNFQPWFEKPPLFMWLTALLYRLFGVSEMSSRALGAICGVATIWLTFEIGRRLTDDWGGLTAAMILLTNGAFIFVSRFGAIDVPLTFCFTVVAYGYLRVLEGDPRWWYAVGAATGIAIMLKGTGGLPAPLSICVALLLDHRFRTIRSPQVRNSVLLACAIALPWHLVMLIAHGRAFFDEYIGFHVLERMKGIEGIGPSQPVSVYLSLYWFTIGPFALVALIGLLLHIKGQRNSSIVISIVLVVTVTFSLIGTKLPHYIMPAVPFVSLLAALAIRRLVKTVRYAIVCAAFLFPIYWFLEREYVTVNYSDKFAYTESFNSRGDPLMRLLVLARPGDHEVDPVPLIICIDDLKLQKQQSVFYGDRPVIKAFLRPPTDERLLANDVAHRYGGLAPLALAVNSRSSPIIIRNYMYPEVAYSGRYNFVGIAQSGPLVLGQISRP